MPELFHIAASADWAAAATGDAGEYRVSTRGVTLDEQGFIHCSLRHQLRAVVERWYADVDDLVLLVVDTERLRAPVRFEPAEAGGEAFPHLYGPLPVGAVTAVLPIARDAEGRFVLPA